MTRFNDLFADPSNNPIKKTGALNLDVMAAIEILCGRYRKHNGIRFDVALTHEQIKEMLGDIESVIYQHEGIRKR